MCVRKGMRRRPATRSTMARRQRLHPAPCREKRPMRAANMHAVLGRPFLPAATRSRRSPPPKNASDSHTSTQSSIFLFLFLACSIPPNEQFLSLRSFSQHTCRFAHTRSQNHNPLQNITRCHCHAEQANANSQAAQTWHPARPTWEPKRTCQKKKIRAKKEMVTRVGFEPTPEDSRSS